MLFSVFSVKEKMLELYRDTQPLSFNTFGRLLVLISLYPQRLFSFDLDHRVTY